MVRLILLRFEVRKLPYKVIGGKATQIKYSSDEVFSRIKHEVSSS